MLHLLDNPGVFHQASTESGTLSMLISSTFLIAAIFIIGRPAMEGRLRKMSSTNLVLAVLLCVVAAAAITVSALIIHHQESQMKSQQAKYDSSVINWLDTDYGIKTNTAIAHQLVNGKSSTVTYNSKEIVISVIETPEKKLSVIDQNHTVLQPKS